MEEKNSFETRRPKDILIEQELEMFEDMTEGQLADYLAFLAEYEPSEVD